MNDEEVAALMKLIDRYVQLNWSANSWCPDAESRAKELEDARAARAAVVAALTAAESKGKHGP